MFSNFLFIGTHFLRLKTNKTPWIPGKAFHQIRYQTLHQRYAPWSGKPNPGILAAIHQILFQRKFPVIMIFLQRLKFIPWLPFHSLINSFWLDKTGSPWYYDLEKLLFAGHFFVKIFNNPNSSTAVPWPQIFAKKVLGKKNRMSHPKKLAIRFLDFQK